MVRERKWKRGKYLKEMILIDNSLDYRTLRVGVLYDHNIGK